LLLATAFRQRTKSARGPKFESPHGRRGAAPSGIFLLKNALKNGILKIRDYIW
jgi:hypothetical protein